MSKYQWWAWTTAFTLLTGCGMHDGNRSPAESKGAAQVARSLAEGLEAEVSLGELAAARGCTAGVRALAAQVARESPVERGDLFRILGTRGAVDRHPEAAALHVEQAAKAVTLSAMPCVSFDGTWLELQLKTWRSAVKWIDTAGGSDQDPVVRRLELGIRPMLQRRIDEANRLRMELSRAAAVTDPRAAAWAEVLATGQRSACDIAMERARSKVVRDMARRISRHHRSMARQVRHALAHAAIKPALEPPLDDVLPTVRQEVQRLEELAQFGVAADVDGAYVQAEIRLIRKELDAIDESILPGIQSPDAIEAFVFARDRLAEDLEMAGGVARFLERMGKRTAQKN